MRGQDAKKPGRDRHSFGWRPIAALGLTDVLVGHPRAHGMRCGDETSRSLSEDGPQHPEFDGALITQTLLLEEGCHGDRAKTQLLCPARVVIL